MRNRYVPPKSYWEELRKVDDRVFEMSAFIINSPTHKRAITWWSTGLNDRTRAKARYESLHPVIRPAIRRVSLTLEPLVRESDALSTDWHITGEIREGHEALLNYTRLYRGDEPLSTPGYKKILDTHGQSSPTEFHYEQLIYQLWRIAASDGEFKLPVEGLNPDETGIAPLAENGPVE